MSAIERRAQKNPVNLIHEGLKVLNDPKLPLSYEERMAYAVPLLKVKHLVLGLPHDPKDTSVPHGGVSDGQADQMGGGAG